MARTVSQAARQRAEIAHRSRYPANTVVFQEGEPGQAAYLIVTGKVEIRIAKDGKDMVVGTLGPGQIFGDYALVDNSPRSATAVTTQATEVVVVTRQMIQAKLKAADPFLVAWIEVLVERIRGLNRRM